MRSVQIQSQTQIDAISNGNHKVSAIKKRRRKKKEYVEREDGGKCGSLHLSNAYWNTSLALPHSLITFLWNIKHFYYTLRYIGSFFLFLYKFGSDIPNASTAYISWIVHNNYRMAAPEQTHNSKYLLRVHNRNFFLRINCTQPEAVCWPNEVVQCRQNQMHRHLKDSADWYRRLWSQLCIVLKNYENYCN